MKLRIPYALREMAAQCAQYRRQTLGQYVAGACALLESEGWKVESEDLPPLNLPEQLTREDSVSITIPDALLPEVDDEEESNAGRIRECLIAKVQRDWPEVRAYNDSDARQYEALKTMLMLHPRPFSRDFFEERLRRWPHLKKFRARFEPMLIDYTPARIRSLTLQAALTAKAEAENTEPD